MDAPKATVIVPTLGASERVAALAVRLAAQDFEHELLVVDNGAGGSFESAAHPRLRVIPSERNLGFGAAVNLAARTAMGSTLVITNDDCLPEDGFLSALVGAVEGSERRELAAGVLVQASDPGLIDSAGVGLDRTLLPFDHLHGEPLGALADAADPIGPTGGAMAVDRALFLRVGGFDERLLAYQEDLDLALRLRLEGIATRLVSGARGLHASSSTLGSGSARKNYLMGFGRGFVLRKWGVVTPRRVAPVLARELTLCAGQAVLDRNLAGIRGRVRGYRSVGREHEFPAEIVAAFATSGPQLTARLRRRLAVRS